MSTMLAMPGTAPRSGYKVERLVLDKDGVAQPYTFEVPDLGPELAGRYADMLKFNSEYDAGHWRDGRGGKYKPADFDRVRELGEMKAPDLPDED